MREVRIKVSEIETAKTLAPKEFKKSKNYKEYRPPKNNTKIKAERTLTTADFIREQIKLRCLSYRKLAAITGVNYNIISQACNSELPSQEQFLKICSFFGYSKQELLDIYEIGLKEALVIKTSREREAYKRVEKIKAGGGNKKKESDNK